MTLRSLVSFGRALAGSFILLAALAVHPAAAQPVVSSQDSLFVYTFSVDQEVYGLVDKVNAVYTVQNLTDEPQELPLCCCGIVFFAIRDSTCAIYEEGCQIAGCDACPTCFPLLNCEMEGCIPIPMMPGEVREFTWIWEKQILCPLDPGFDLIFGNVGTFRMYGGYQVCPNGHLDGLLEIPINILTQVPVLPLSWGGIKVRHGEAGPSPVSESPPPSDRP